MKRWLIILGRYFRDTESGFIHLAGALAAIIGTVFLTLRAKDNIQLFSYIIFGISMILLFSASTAYHLTKREGLVRILRRIDHSMIFIFIAGTYTPVVMQSFEGALKWGYIIGIWLVALAGTILKIFLTGRLRKLFTAFYILMGWSGTFAIMPLSKAIGAKGTALLIIGGLFYTIGGIIYALKKPKLCKSLGFHELFHIFVLLGAVCMYFLIYFYC
jgi:hemolysin III